jgi:uncharacterized protein YpmB
MDKKSQILVVIFTILFTASIVATFYRYILLEDVTYETDENAFQESLLEE